MQFFVNWTILCLWEEDDEKKRYIQNNDIMCLLVNFNNKFSQKKKVKLLHTQKRKKKNVLQQVYNDQATNTTTTITIQTNQTTNILFIKGKKWVYNAGMWCACNLVHSIRSITPELWEVSRISFHFTKVLSCFYIFFLLSSSSLLWFPWFIILRWRINKKKNIYYS